MTFVSIFVSGFFWDAVCFGIIRYRGLKTSEHLKLEMFNHCLHATACCYGPKKKAGTRGN